MYQQMLNENSQILWAFTFKPMMATVQLLSAAMDLRTHLNTHTTSTAK